MATRIANRTSDESSTASSAAPDTLEQKVVALAEQMGRLIGTVQAKAEGWLDRASLEEQLTRIRESAADVLAHLNPAAASAQLKAVARRASGARRSGKADGLSRSGRSGGLAKKTSGRGRSGGAVDAPGKKHRPPMPTVHGAKHSDERIAKLRTASEVRRRRKGGS